MLKIEFISYDGKYPNLCRGVCVMRINDKEYRFGHHYDQYDYKTQSFKDETVRNLGEFWGSGGGLNPNYEGAWQAPWELNCNSEYPDELKGLEHELLRVFNENVRFGCCGGCI